MDVKTGILIIVVFTFLVWAVVVAACEIWYRLNRSFAVANVLAVLVLFSAVVAVLSGVIRNHYGAYAPRTLLGDLGTFGSTFVFFILPSNAHRVARMIYQRKNRGAPPDEDVRVQKEKGT